MFGSKRYKKLQAQADECERDIRRVRGDNHRLEDRIIAIEIKNFNDRYPNGQLRQYINNVYGGVETAIDLLYVTNDKIVSKRISCIPKKLHAFKIKQTEKSIYIGLKFTEQEEFYVLNKAASVCIKLEETGLQDMEWVESTSVI